MPQRASVSKRNFRLKVAHTQEQDPTKSEHPHKNLHNHQTHIACVERCCERIGSYGAVVRAATGCQLSAQSRSLLGNGGAAIVNKSIALIGCWGREAGFVVRGHVRHWKEAKSLGIQFRVTQITIKQRKVQIQLHCEKTPARLLTSGLHEADAPGRHHESPILRHAVRRLRLHRRRRPLDAGGTTGSRRRRVAAVAAGAAPPAVLLQLPFPV